MSRSFLYTLIALSSTVPAIGCVGHMNQESVQSSPLPAAITGSSATVVSGVEAATEETTLAKSEIRPVAHRDFGEPAADQASTTDSVLTIDGKRYRLQPLVEESVARSSDHSLAAYESAPLLEVPESGLVGLTPEPVVLDSMGQTSGVAMVSPQTVQMNLPTALAMIDSQHPAVGLAQWRTREAYAALDQAKVLWLPSIQAGFSFHRHDGNYQSSNGDIVDVNRNSFQYGLGAGATGAGTTNTRPGLVAQFHMADAIFQPKVAEKTAWARGHAAAGVLNQQLLRAATAYTELLEAYQDARVLEESRERVRQLARITSDFAEAGQGMQADADRMQTELRLIDSRLVGGQERVAVASARLAQAISMHSGETLLPMDVTVVPLELMAAGTDKASLISTGLASRPELKESQSLVAAACEAYKREQYAPFVPSVLLGYSTGGFGGGLGNDLSDVDGRYDFDAVVTWEIRNFGLGERAARNRTSARVQQARYEKLRVMDQVAAEISESASQVEFRRQQMDLTQQAIATAERSYQSNSERIQDGEGLPIEVLQAVQALESARRAYLQAVTAHNQAQFRLQWALGWPVGDDQTLVTH
ncbi:putative outer membrane protein [Rhodopirellula islandica]|uniref:Outer membrane protein n=1 Tax=Rhodopirellula islandica TaxID=595434 RepID=A0A0J1E7B3_RHOIS|nr:TolC family protein [Rhodopirellula islandica]KLU01349.1 putative outer membrane protein [Rhodopirellula islandica]